MIFCQRLGLAVTINIKAQECLQLCSPTEEEATGNRDSAVSQPVSQLNSLSIFCLLLPPGTQVQDDASILCCGPTETPNKNRTGLFVQNTEDSGAARTHLPSLSLLVMELSTIPAQPSARLQGKTPKFPYDFILPMPGRGVGCCSPRSSSEDINVSIISMGSALEGIRWTFLLRKPRAKLRCFLAGKRLWEKPEEST